MRRALTLAVLTLSTSALAQPLTTSFVYQGELRSAGTPITTPHDVRFSLWTAPAAGAQIGPVLCIDNLTPIDGRFSTPLDFGAVFTGQRLYLQIETRSDTGLNCAITSGFSALTPRQELTITPHAAYALSAGTAATAVTATTATTATNATQLNSQPPSFYTNAANLSAGTISDARLSSNVANLAAAQTFTGVKNFNAAPVFNAAGSPFSVAASGVVTNLNADLLDGQHAAAFALTAHTHDAAAITSGLLNDARLSTNIPRLNTNNIFTTTATFGGRVTVSEASLSGGAVQGTHTGASLNHYGIFGLASTTGTSSAVGVRGEARGNSGSGVYGLATSTTGQVYGVLGLANSTSNTLAAGVYGEGLSTNGVYGYSSSYRALYGRSDTGTALYAQSTSGGTALYAVRTANNNRGWFGGAGEGGWAESPTGTGFVAKTTTGTFALYAERNPGGTPANVNRGWFGGSGEGAWAESDQGNGLVALSRGLSAAAVYCRNDAGGRALFADGVAAVRALEILGGADLAEPFDISGDPLPGMVVAIDPNSPGQLRIAHTPYDTAVAGIISGANGLSPGMVMRDDTSTLANGSHPVAMTGRVWCYVDATHAEIRPGDRLTTSATPGHAMRVLDEARSPGTVIGKAMTPLAKGERGLVLVLVNLQ
ncbi:MAG: hypothetical protein IPM33_04580 [Phycisphaerales bacterium]|nr:hypothetical protein [Phycisphaerales bacterium]